MAAQKEEKADSKSKTSQAGEEKADSKFKTSQAGEEKADSKSKASQAGDKAGKSAEVSKKGEAEREPRAATPAKDWPDPEKKLKELEEKLKQLQEQMEEIKKQNQSCKDDKTKLEALLGEFAKILAAYTKALVKIKGDSSDFTHYSEKKTEMIETAIKGHEGEIEQAIEGVNQEIEQLKTKAEELKGAMESAKADFDQASENYANKQKVLDDLKTRQQFIEGNHKALNKLRDQIEKEEEESKYAVMYYLITDFNNILTETKPAIVSESQLKAALYLAWQQLDTAEDAMQAKEALWKTAEQAYAIGMEMLKEAQDQKRDNILEKLSHIEI